MISQLAGKKPFIEKAMMGVFSGFPGVNFDVRGWVKRASQKLLEYFGVGYYAAATAENDFIKMIGAVGRITGLVHDLVDVRTLFAFAVKRKYVGENTALAVDLPKLEETPPGRTENRMTAGKISG